MPVKDYLKFTVSDADVFTVDANGLLTILDNSVGQVPVVLTIASTRDAKVNTPFKLFSNLLAKPFDVDVGLRSGGPFALSDRQRKIGSTFCYPFASTRTRKHSLRFRFD